MAGDYTYGAGKGISPPRLSLAGAPKGMTGSLIINARDRLRWHQRLWSDASTLLMWGAWLKLWYPVLRSFSWATDFSFLSRVTHLTLLSSGHAIDLPRYAVALAGTSGTLLLWNQLPSLKMRTPEAPTVSDYARHFELPVGELLAGRERSVCVVHHDEGGRIVRVERKGE